jgi:hypothetical protein
MKTLDTLRALIRENLNEASDDATIDLQQQQQQADSSQENNKSIDDSVLVKAYKRKPFTRLFVFRQETGTTWEIVPSNNGRTFEFYELRFKRLGDPIRPKSIADLKAVEHNFNLYLNDKDEFDVSHVTFIR